MLSRLRTTGRAARGDAGGTADTVRDPGGGVEPRERDEKPRAGAVLLVASGLVMLAAVLAVGSFAELGLTFAATTTPIAVLIGTGLIACGVSAWVQPASRVLAGILGFGFALAALPGANLGGGIVGTVLGVLGAAALLSWTPDRHPPAGVDAAGATDTAAGTDTAGVTETASGEGDPHRG